MRFTLPGQLCGPKTFLFVCAVMGVAVLGPGLRAQTCTTQAKMTAAQRSDAGAAAYKLASAVQSGESDAVKTAAIAQIGSDFAQTAYLIRTTAAELKGDSLAVTQIYLLDATARTANDSSDADFTCPLAGSAAETDFSITGLPPGRYAFAMVEASGPHPWLLSFLLQAEAGGWKMAGFYPHVREAAGHAGLWYWTTARANAKDGKNWLAWTLYGEADQLLRPANFVSTTNLDRLRSEERSVTPPALSDGLSSKTPLVIKGANGAEFRITGLKSEGSEDGKQLNLVVHLEGEAAADANAATARNLAAGAALLGAHPELRSVFDNVWLIAETPGSNPFVTERPMAQIGQGK